MEPARPSRRKLLATVLGAGGLALGAVASSCGPALSKGSADDRAATDGDNAYEKALRTASPARAMIASPHLSSAFGYLGHADNWLRAMERSSHHRASETRLALVTYGPMNFITYDDTIWSTYRVGEWQSIIDPGSGRPATQNPYATFVRQLQQRGCVFSACANALQGHSQAAVGRGPSPGMTVDQVHAQFASHLLPRVHLVPAGVSEISRLQQRGFPYIYWPKEM